MAQIHDITATPAGDLILSPDHTRSTGLHVSTVIQDICLDLGYLKRNDQGQIQDPDRIPVDGLTIRDPNPTTVFPPEVVRKIVLGLAWEEWLAPANPHISYHLGEMELDGIVGTPDGLSTPPPPHRAIVIHEFKLTWKSCRHKTPLECPWWAMQAKAYCAMMGTHIVQWHVYYVCGDYNYPLQPQYRVYWAVFERQEIIDNWRMIHTYATKHYGLKTKLTKELFA